jgi:hypothetical protein
VKCSWKGGEPVKVVLAGGRQRSGRQGGCTIQTKETKVKKCKTKINKTNQIKIKLI